MAKGPDKAKIIGGGYEALKQIHQFLNQSGLSDSIIQGNKEVINQMQAHFARLADGRDNIAEDIQMFLRTMTYSLLQLKDPIVDKHNDDKEGIFPTDDISDSLTQGRLDSFIEPRHTEKVGKFISEGIIWKALQEEIESQELISKLDTFSQDQFVNMLAQFQILLRTKLFRRLFKVYKIINIEGISDKAELKQHLVDHYRKALSPNKKLDPLYHVLIFGNRAELSKTGSDLFAKAMLNILGEDSYAIDGNKKSTGKIKTLYSKEQVRDHFSVLSKPIVSYNSDNGKILMTEDQLNDFLANYFEVFEAAGAPVAVECVTDPLNIFQLVYRFYDKQRTRNKRAYAKLVHKTFLSNEKWEEDSVYSHLKSPAPNYPTNWP